jgi:PIN domain nuclease of toxin-antitoxin system
MKYIIDTHTFLWFINGSTEISHNALALIENKEFEIFISIASLWEISIKSA